MSPDHQQTRHINYDFYKIQPAMVRLSHSQDSEKEEKSLQESKTHRKEERLGRIKIQNSSQGECWNAYRNHFHNM